MSEPGLPAAVSVRGIGKRYHIGARPGAGSLYDRLGRVGRRATGTALDPEPSIWALRDIGFDVLPGNVVGVIGRNGSGKSTLMRILARVTAPTEGEAVVRGRVGALLQVGTGFHPELTGRDNIALSGAILGMSRSEIASVEEQIIDFADVSEFLDTPVKHYSSGMYLRLAFSVSAHLRAEVMLVDEVLAVGDAAFQEKCRRRIREMVSDGRTVLLVSHQLDMIERTCDSAVVLEKGTLVFSGSPEAATAAYLKIAHVAPPATSPNDPAGVR